MSLGIVFLCELLPMKVYLKVDIGFLLQWLKDEVREWERDMVGGRGEEKREGRGKEEVWCGVPLVRLGEGRWGRKCM